MKWTELKLKRLAEVNKLTKIQRYFEIKKMCEDFVEETEDFFWNIIHSGELDGSLESLRPAFHMDDELKEAATKAGAAFDEEEKDV